MRKQISLTTTRNNNLSPAEQAVSDSLIGLLEQIKELLISKEHAGIDLVFSLAKKMITQFCSRIEIAPSSLDPLLSSLDELLREDLDSGINSSFQAMEAKIPTMVKRLNRVIIGKLNAGVDYLEELGHNLIQETSGFFRVTDEKITGQTDLIQLYSTTKPNTAASRILSTNQAPRTTPQPKKRLHPESLEQDVANSLYDFLKIYGPTKTENEIQMSVENFMAAAKNLGGNHDLEMLPSASNRPSSRHTLKADRKNGYQKYVTISSSKLSTMNKKEWEIVTEKEGIERIQRAIQDKKIEETDEKGRTALMYVAFFGSIRGAQEIKKGFLPKRFLSDPFKTFVNCVDNVDKNGRTALMYAAFNGHLELAHFLIENGAEINAFTSKTYETPLMYAAMNGHTKMVELLLDKGAEANAYTYQAWERPLIYAAINGHTAVIKLLLKHKADINAYTRNTHETALMYAAMNGHTATVRLLLQQGARVSTSHSLTQETSLIYAAMNGHSKIVELLLVNKDIKVNACTCETHETSLMYAAMNGHTEVVKLLLDSNANVNAKKRDTGETALMYAAAYGHSGVASLLVEAKDIEINAQQPKTNFTASMYAAEYGNLEVFKILVSHGATHFVVLEAQQTVLMRAACNGHYSISKYLADKNVHLNSRDNNHLTASMHAALSGHAGIVVYLCQKASKTLKEDGLPTELMCAAQIGNLDVIKALVYADIELHPAFRQTTPEITYPIELPKKAAIHPAGQTALMQAVYKGHLDVVNYLLSTPLFESKVNECDEYGRSILMYAAYNGHEGIMGLLLRKGADPNQVDNCGQSALRYATIKGQERAIHLLLQAGADISITDDSGKTVLQHAAKNKNISGLLLARSIRHGNSISDSRRHFSFFITSTIIPEHKKTSVLVLPTPLPSSSTIAPPPAAGRPGFFPPRPARVAPPPGAPTPVAPPPLTSAANKDTTLLQGDEARPSVGGISIRNSSLSSSSESKGFGDYLTVRRETRGRETIYEFNLSNAWTSLELPMKQQLKAVVGEFEPRNRGMIISGENIIKISLLKEHAKNFLDSLQSILPLHDTTLPGEESKLSLRR